MDLHKINKKLTYLRKQLNLIINPNDNENESDADSGYYPHEDMEPELSMIKSIRHNVKNLKNENYELKTKLQGNIF